MKEQECRMNYRDSTKAMKNGLAIDRLVSSITEKAHIWRCVKDKIRQDWQKWKTKKMHHMK